MSTQSYSNLLGDRCPVLVVDHDRLVNWVVKEWVEAAGHKAFVADDEATAIETLKASPEIRVLVADLSMPGMNGLQSIEKALACRPALGIVIVTRSADVPPLPAECQLIRKPFFPTGLQDALARACAHSRKRDRPMP